MKGQTAEIVSLVDRLAAFYFVAKRYGTRLHTDANLTTGERAVLKELARLGERTVPQIADRRGISRQAIQRTIDSLERRGLVTKHVPDNDRRNRIIRLSGSGKKLLKAVHSVELEEARDLQDALTRRQLEQVNETLDVLELGLEQRIAELENDDRG